MGNSVAGKIALGAMLLVIATVTATGYAAIAQQTAALERAEKTTADLLATAIVVTSSSDILRDDIANLSQTVRRLQENNPSLLSIVIRGTDGAVKAAHPAHPEDVAPGMNVVRPIAIYSQNYGQLELVFNTAERDRARADILNTTVSVTAVLLIISLVGALLWAAYFARPIVTLADAADRVASGDLSTRVSVGRRDEIGRLGERFNGMVENLEKARADLERTLNELSTLYSVSRIINSTSNREEILKLNIETLATGFGFSEVAILLETDRRWKLAALRSDGTTSSRSEAVDALDALGLQEAAQADGATPVSAVNLPASWRFSPDCPAYAVPLRSGSNLVGLLVAGGKAARDDDATKVLGVVASQIAPPILISLMSDREQQRLNNPFSFIYSRLDASLARTAGFGVGLALLSFRFNRSLWNANPTAAERRFEDVIAALKIRVADAELIVRYGLDRVLVIVPGWSKSDARQALMTLDLPDIDELSSGMVASPDDGLSAHELLAALERG